MLMEEGNLRTKVGPVYLLLYSSSHFSFLLPLFLLPLVTFSLSASPTEWHFKNSRLYPMMAISRPSLLIHRKVLYFIGPPKKAETSFFCLLGVRPGRKHLPLYWPRAIKSLQLRDRRRTFKDGISSQPVIATADV